MNPILNPEPPPSKTCKTIIPKLTKEICESSLISDYSILVDIWESLTSIKFAERGLALISSVEPPEFQVQLVKLLDSSQLSQPGHIVTNPKKSKSVAYFIDFLTRRFDLSREEKEDKLFSRLFDIAPTDYSTVREFVNQYSSVVKDCLANSHL